MSDSEADEDTRTLADRAILNAVIVVAVALVVVSGLGSITYSAFGWVGLAFLAISVVYVLFEVIIGGLLNIIRKSLKALLH